MPNLPRLAGSLEFEIERVRALYGQLPQAWLAQIMYCGTLFGYYFGRTDMSRTFLWIWISCVLILVLVRGALILAYRKRWHSASNEFPSGILKWEKYSAILCLAAGLLQASFLYGIYLLDPYQQFVYFASIFITLMGSVNLYSASTVNYWSFCAPVLIAGQLGLGIQADALGPVIGAVLVFFIVYLVLVFRRTQTTFLRSITDRIEADQSLRREVQVMDSLQIGVVQLSNGVIIRCNQLFADQLRTNKDLLTGAVLNSLFANELDQKNFDDTVALLLPQTASSNVVLWFTAPAGGMVAYNVKITRQPSLRSVELVLMLQPLDAYQDSDTAYEIAIEGSGAGLLDWNPQTNQIRFSDRFKQLMGYEHDHPAFKQDWWLTQSIHEEDRSRVVHAFEAHFEQTQVFDELFRLKQRDGRYLTVHVRGASVRDDTGRAVRFIAAITPLGGMYGLRGAQQDDPTFFQTIVPPR